ncbi:hypothetical protein V6N13_104862 [Hibiscus sabdariffa]
MSLVLATKQWERIEAVIDLEVGTNMFQDHVVEIQGPDASFGERQLAIKASHCNVSSWKSISDSSPIADKRSESGDSAEDKTLGNSENDKLMGSGNVSLEKNNLDGEKSNRQLVVESSRQEGEELLHGKVNKCSWATVVARSSPEIPLETGGTQLHYGNESDNPLSPNKAAVEPINRDGLHSVSLGGSKNGQEHQEASFSWAQTIDLVNNKSIPDCIEIGKPSNQREAEELDKKIEDLEKKIEVWDELDDAERLNPIAQDEVKNWMTKVRAKHSRLAGLDTADGWLIDPDKVKRRVFEFFSKHFNAPIRGWKAKLCVSFR